MCGLSKQYLCDLEHGRKKLKVETRTAAKLAAALEVDVDEIISRIEKLTNRERKTYCDYYRTLRSRLRAERIHKYVRTIINTTQELRIAIRRRRDVDGALQTLEIAARSLDHALAYRRGRDEPGREREKPKTEKTAEYGSTG